MEKLIKQQLIEALSKAYNLVLDDVPVEHPENPVFGDYSTSLPLILASQLKQSPMEIAKKLVYEIDRMELTGVYREKTVKIFSNVNTAPPGFVNFVLSEDWLHKLLNEPTAIGQTYGSGEKYDSQNIIIEYTDPNPFKVFHIGHLMTNCIGESLSRIFEFEGANVKRANFQGDVGMHVSKSIWGLKRLLEEDKTSIEELSKKDLESKVEYLGKAYAYGAKRFESNEEAAQEMRALNLKIFYVAQQLLCEKEGWAPLVDYKGLIEGSSDAEISEIKTYYSYGREWSLDYFETLYKRLGTKFDFYFFESVVGEMGLKIVYKYLKEGIFEENEGAVIFKGEQYGLHTRVFINSLGLPIYEAKDLGLAFLKYEHFIYDKSIIVTANEQDDYFKVVLKAMAQINPDVAGKTNHIGHGMMVFKEGKMSSRTGDVVSGVKMLDDLKQKAADKIRVSQNSTVKKDDIDNTADKIAVAAIKYAILKNGIGNDIVYDPEEILNLNGNTGPYLLYTFTRTVSVLKKAGISDFKELTDYNIDNITLQEKELALMRHLYKFPESVVEASNKLAPNMVAGFIFDLAQKYNAFYAQIPILDAENEDEKNFRLALTASTQQVLNNGLDLLGIHTVAKM